MGIAALAIGVVSFILAGIPIVGTIIFKLLALGGVVVGSMALTKSDKQAAAIPLAGLIICAVVIMGGSVSLF